MDDEACEAPFSYLWASARTKSCRVSLIPSVFPTPMEGLCCNWENPFSVVYWKGSAPFCNADCLDCNDGDYCIVKHKCGDGGLCNLGYKRLCGHLGSLTVAELEELEKISEYTKAREEMAMLMGGSHPVQAIEESEPGLVLAYVNYEKITMHRDN